MNTVIKLFLVAALALVLAPHSLANDWVPNGMIKAAYSSALQPDSSNPANIPKNLMADNPTTMTNGKRGAKPVVQHTPMNEWVPIDMLRPWVFPPDP